MEAVETDGHLAHFFLGDDPALWRQNVPTFLAVLYEGLYPGIDLKVYGRGTRIEYDWVVGRTARLEAIRFAFENIRSAGIDQGGDLVVETSGGTMIHQKPCAYQMIAGRRVEVACRSVPCGENAFGFAADDVSSEAPLVIDPVVLAYSTFLGGSGLDYGRALAVDAKGAVYLTGDTWSKNFPQKSALQAVNKGSNDVFVSKLSPSGTSLVYSTYLGGTSMDYGNCIAVDSAGCAYIAGSTLSSDFPLKNRFQSSKKYWTEAFVAKLSASGSSLEYATFLGGSDIETAAAIAVDGVGSAYITGRTFSGDFPLLNAFQSRMVYKPDAFITKLTPSGSALAFSSYLGGSSIDDGFGIAVDAAGSVFVAGSTSSSDFPLKNPLQGTSKYGEAFVMKFDPSGSSLVFSTFLGGSGTDDGRGLALDGSGAVYLIGDTSSKDFPLKGAFQKSHRGGLSDIFVTKINPEATGLVFSTYIGSPGWDKGAGIAVGADGSPVIVGKTDSAGFPVKTPFQKSSQGSSDVIVAKLIPAGSGLVYSTYLGGSDLDDGYGIQVDGKGAVYVAGETRSADFPVKKSLRRGGETDAFIAKLELGEVVVVSPNGGESWSAGKPYWIKWTFSGAVGIKVKIELLKGGKMNRVIASSAPIGANGKGSFKWTVPAAQAAGTNYRVRITSRLNTACGDSSDGYLKIVK